MLSYFREHFLSTRVFVVAEEKTVKRNWVFKFTNGLNESWEELNAKTLFYTNMTFYQFGARWLEEVTNIYKTNRQKLDEILCFLSIKL